MILDLWINLSKWEALASSDIRDKAMSSKKILIILITHNSENTTEHLLDNIANEILRYFKDTVFPFKDHYVVDLGRPIGLIIVAAITVRYNATHCHSLRQPDVYLNVSSVPLLMTTTKMLGAI